MTPLSAYLFLSPSSVLPLVSLLNFRCLQMTSEKLKRGGGKDSWVAWTKGVAKVFKRWVTLEQAN